jgi:hypothetical protein
MNDPKRFKSQALGLTQILFDDPLHIAGWNAVKIKDIGNQYADRLGKWITVRIERHEGLP